VQPERIKQLHNATLEGEVLGVVRVDATLALPVKQGAETIKHVGPGYLYFMQWRVLSLVNPLPEWVESVDDANQLSRRDAVRADGFFVEAGGQLMKANALTAKMLGSLVGPSTAGDPTDTEELLGWIRRKLAEGAIEAADVETFAKHPRVSGELRQAIIDDVTARLSGLSATERTRYLRSDQVLAEFAHVTEEILGGGWPVFLEVLRDRVARTATGDLLTLLDKLKAAA
jgi:hypothetical protein